MRCDLEIVGEERNFPSKKNSNRMSTNDRYGYNQGKSSGSNYGYKNYDYHQRGESSSVPSLLSLGNYNDFNQGHDIPFFHINMFVCVLSNKKIDFDVTFIEGYGGKDAVNDFISVFTDNWKRRY